MEGFSIGPDPVAAQVSRLLTCTSVAAAARPFWEKSDLLGTFMICLMNVVWECFTMTFKLVSVTSVDVVDEFFGNSRRLNVPACTRRGWRAQLRWQAEVGHANHDFRTKPVTPFPGCLFCVWRGWRAHSWLGRSLPVTHFLASGRCRSRILCAQNVPLVWVAWAIHETGGFVA